MIVVSQSNVNIFKQDDYVPVIISSGSNMITAIQLNMSWTVAPANALLKSALLVICPRATIVLVTDVPMLAPIIIGMAVFTSITGGGNIYIYTTGCLKLNKTDVRYRV